MPRALGLGAILFGFWLTLSGHYTPLLVGLGAGSCALVVYLAMRMDVVDHEGVPLHVLGRALIYFPWLMWEVVKANVDVAKVILDPKLPISPRLVQFHGSQKSDLGRAIYGNSITLTPGTITIGIEGQEYQIHALRAEDLDSKEPAEMDQLCTWVEGH